MFSNIRTKYGQECVKDVRKLEDLTRKVSRHRNHLVFTTLQRHQCNTSQSQSEMPDKHDECDENSGQSQEGPSERENTCHKQQIGRV